jgi:hypothetical protein
MVVMGKPAGKVEEALIREGWKTDRRGKDVEQRI